MMALATILQWISVLCAFVAAVIWLRAALVKTPDKLTHLIHSPIDGSEGLEGELADLARGVRRQGYLNAWAAAWTAGAALLQGISIGLMVKMDEVRSLFGLS
jgi:hypothetical protein